MNNENILVEVADNMVNTVTGTGVAVDGGLAAVDVGLVAEAATGQQDPRPSSTPRTKRIHRLWLFCGPEQTADMWL